MSVSRLSGDPAMADEIPVEATTTLAARVAADPQAAPRHLRLRVLNGSAIMLLSSVFVGGMNLIYNFLVAHKLGADKFGHASVVYTLLMLLSSVTLSFQLVCSKFVARSESTAEKIAIYKLLHRWAWVCAVLLGTLIAIASGGISDYLNLPTKTLILLLALATMFYVPLGVRRGFMQGTYDFAPLAFNYSFEVVIKLLGALALVGSYGVQGVVGAMTTSVIVAYMVGLPRKHHVGGARGTTLRAGMGEGIQAVAFFIGQVIICNLDIILVKHFFDPTQAGVYAAVALVGRVVYMLSWSVVSSMFPFSAGLRAGDSRGHAVLTTALALVAGISSLFVFAVWIAPPRLWHTLLGSGFPVGQHLFYSSLLILYATTTALYALGVVLMTYEISRKIGNVSWVQLSFSGAIIVGIYLFHSTLNEVILVQLVLMLALLLVVSVPFVRGQSDHPPEDTSGPPALRGLHRIRQVDENEVIAQFLESEFFQEEYKAYRDAYAHLVTHPDLGDDRENAIRRALLFHRRGRLWRELPEDTEWWEVELEAADLDRVRIFARNHWLRYGAPSFLLLDTVEVVRSQIERRSRDPFVRKLRSLSTEMAGDAEYTSVILISIDSSTPLTILEGNHRMTAAALLSPETLHHRFRFICGFSPHMADCCWYRTDISTLWRYAVNTLAYYLIDRHKLTTAVLQAEAVPAHQNADVA
jgi:O-antigen/teichoic acid export membrane protein